MHVLMTGGAGDLGTVLTAPLIAAGMTPISLDIQPPRHPNTVDRRGSLLDRSSVSAALAGIDAIVHIAGWHGIHEVKGMKNAYDFWDLNATGTFNILEAAARGGINNFVYISSTSIDDEHGVYGHSKRLGEDLVHTYQARHGISAIILRPRAFIPHWNRAAYEDYIGWARWFWRGAVHIDDVAAAVMLSLSRLQREPAPTTQPLVVDGAYDFSAKDLADWDAAGPGSTFARVYPDFVAAAQKYGLDTSVKPEPKESPLIRETIGYVPRFSLRDLLTELVQYGSEGPPGPDLTPITEDL